MDQEHDCGFNNYNTTIATYDSIYGCFQHCLGLSSRSDPCTYVYSATPFKHSHINKPLTMHGPRLCFRLVFNNEHIPPQTIAVLYSLQKACLFVLQSAWEGSSMCISCQCLYAHMNFDLCSKVMNDHPLLLDVGRYARLD